MHKMLNIEITKIDGSFWSQTGTDQSLRKLFIYFFEATQKCQFSERNECPIHEKKNYIRTLYFLRFEKWHFLWIQVVLIKFISRFFCWEKTLIHLALQTTTKNLFHQKERFDLFSNNISMLDRKCYRLNFVDMLFSQEIHLLLFCSFSKVSHRDWGGDVGFDVYRLIFVDIFCCLPRNSTSHLLLFF